MKANRTQCYNSDDCESGICKWNVCGGITENRAPPQDNEANSEIIYTIIVVITILVLVIMGYTCWKKSRQSSNKSSGRTFSTAQRINGSVENRESLDDETPEKKLLTAN